MKLLAPIVAAIPALLFAALALANPTYSLTFTYVALAAAVVGMVVYLLSFDLERVVAMRYLRRARTPRLSRVGLPASVALLLLGVVLAMTQHGPGQPAHRSIETIGVLLAFAGALGASAFGVLAAFTVHTGVSILGVALGVACLVVISSVTSGFEREFQKSVFAVNGHLIVFSYGNPSFDESAKETQSIAKKLAGFPGLQRIERFSVSAGEVMVGKMGANLKGVDLAAGADELRRSLVDGSVDALGKPGRCANAVGEGDAPPRVGRILLGQELARKLRVKIGDCIKVMVPLPSQGDLDALPSFPFEVVGRFHFGFNEYDARLAYISLDDASWVSSARASVIGAELRFEDPMRALSAVEEVEERLGPEMRVLDWRALNGNIFRALQLQKVVLSLILGIIIIVAALNTVASLTLIVLMKTREIAILGAMGARGGAVLRLFLVAGALVGVLGAGLGLALGFLACGLLARYGYALDAKVYNVEQLPVLFAPDEILVITAAALFICVAFTVFPALRASRLRALDGLRYE